MLEKMEEGPLADFPLRLSIHLQGTLLFVLVLGCCLLFHFGGGFCFPEGGIGECILDYISL